MRGVVFQKSHDPPPLTEIAFAAIEHRDLSARGEPPGNAEPDHARTRWGKTKGKIGFHGGKVAVHRPRVRGLDGHELPLPTWTAAQAEDWLGRWAMNLMLINVSTRKLRLLVFKDERTRLRLLAPLREHVIGLHRRTFLWRQPNRLRPLELPRSMLN